MPESFRNTDISNKRTYKIVRVHEGKVTIIEGNYDSKTNIFTFETDLFSTYALAYEDKTTGADIIAANDFYHLRLTAKAYQNSQKIVYTKVSGADGYIIYGAPCGEEYKMKKLAELSKTVTSYTQKKLKKATYYKYQVKAYKIVNGKKVIIAISRVIHSVTTGKVYANPTKVITDSSLVKLTAGKSKQVTCKVVLPKGKKMKKHTPVIRYESTNAAIATVSSSGKITAISKGNCYVYAYAQNGVYIKIKVTVN